MGQQPLGPTDAVLYRVQRGLAGYVSYLAACEMNKAFSEYVLYEPTLRILTAQSYIVETERRCPGFPVKSGDKKKIDFVVTDARANVHFAMEMKWTKKRRIPRVEDDIEKLHKYREHHPDAECLLCVFGVMSVLKELRIPDHMTESRDPVYADLKKTKYGCRIFKLRV